MKYKKKERKKEEIMMVYCKALSYCIWIKDIPRIHSFIHSFSHAFNHVNTCGFQSAALDFELCLYGRGSEVNAG